MSTSRATFLYSQSFDSGTVIFMRVAMYGRVSKDNGSQNTENQLHELRDFCHRSKWAIEHEYVDRASGRTADRPQFKKLFEDAAKRRFDLVLFWSLDRFTREGVMETLNHLQRLSAYGVNWRSYQENYLDSCGPFKDVVISLMLRWPSKSGCAYRSGPRQAYNELGERGRYSEGHGWKWT